MLQTDQKKDHSKEMTCSKPNTTRQSNNVGKRTTKVPSAVNSNPKNVTRPKDKKPHSAPEQQHAKNGLSRPPKTGLKQKMTSSSGNACDNTNSKKTKSSLQKSTKVQPDETIKAKSITANANRKTKSGKKLSTAKHKNNNTNAATTTTGTSNKESGLSVSENSKAKSGDLLLTARHHRNSLTSPGEAAVSPYGEVQTMVCEVSPVPSDVESIDCFRTSKPQTKGQVTVGRSQQTLKVGHGDKSSSFSLLSKNRHSYSGNCSTTRKPSNTITTSKSDKSEEIPLDNSLQADSITSNTLAASDVAVRIVPDSATKSNSQPTARKDIALENGKPQVKQGNKPKEVVKQPANKAATAKIVQSSTKPNIRTSKIKKEASLFKPRPVEESNPKEIKKSSLGSTLRTSDLDINEETDKADKQHQSEHGTPPDESPDNHPLNTIPVIAQYNEKCLEESLNLEIPADLECRKAYIILNSQGFNVSLNTLRRALLTPTDYRKIQAMNQQNKSV